MSESSMAADVEGSSYRTWPDRMGLVGGKKETDAGRRPSLSGLLMAKSPKNLEALDVLRRPNLATALSSLSISYSPKTRGLHDSEVKERALQPPTGSQMAKVPMEDTGTKSCDDLDLKPSGSYILRSDDSICYDWNPPCGSKQRDEVVPAEIHPSEKEKTAVEPDSNLLVEDKESGLLSKEELLQDDENQGEVFGQQRFLPTHRKAFSLPRTLEVKKI